MTLKEMRDYCMGLLGLHTYVNGRARSYLCNFLTPASSVQTRGSSDENFVYVPYVNCDLFRQSFEYRTPALWNSLPSYFRKEQV